MAGFIKVWSMFFCMRLKKEEVVILAIVLVVGIAAVFALWSDFTRQEMFSIIVLPDTQSLVKNDPKLFNEQINWIVENKKALNIVFVTHVGDIVQDANNATQWETASQVLSRLDGVVPYGVAYGNHDAVFREEYVDDGFFSDKSIVGRDTYLFNAFFPVEKYRNESWWGGDDGSMDNTFQMFDVSGLKFMMLHIEYLPSYNATIWAENAIRSVLSKYPAAKIIVTTHSWLTEMGYDCNNSEFSRRAAGVEPFWSMLEKYENAFLVLSGHTMRHCRRVDSGIRGNAIYQLTANWQNVQDFRGSTLRILMFFPDKGRIEVITYAPFYDHREKSDENEFIVQYRA